MITFPTEPLVDLFNNTYTTAVLPSDWKAAVTCPILKKGEPEGVTKNLPVSLNVVSCKVFDRFLKRVILSSLSEYNAITAY